MFLYIRGRFFLYPRNKTSLDTWVCLPRGLTIDSCPALCKDNCTDILLFADKTAIKEGVNDEKRYKNSKNIYMLMFFL